jgi:phosphoribosyl-dephospho-CoA transferase
MWEYSPVCSLELEGAVKRSMAMAKVVHRAMEAMGLLARGTTISTQVTVTRLPQTGRAPILAISTE